MLRRVKRLAGSPRREWPPPGLHRLASAAPPPRHRAGWSVIAHKRGLISAGELGLESADIEARRETAWRLRTDPVHGAGEADDGGQQRAQRPGSEPSVGSSDRNWAAVSPSGLSAGGTNIHGPTELLHERREAGRRAKSMPTVGTRKPSGLTAPTWNLIAHVPAYRFRNRSVLVSSRLNTPGPDAAVLLRKKIIQFQRRIGGPRRRNIGDRQHHRDSCRMAR